MSGPRLAAITIDVDSLRFYRQIHGLDGSAEVEDDDPIYHLAMPRFFELCARHRAPPTLFLVGRDAPRFAERFAGAGALGAEVASHSFDHDYRLSARASEDIAADLARADAALRPLNGGRPLAGFRAPGYNVTPALLAEVQRIGYRWDSSLLPSPAYFALRAAAIGAYALRRRPSRSLAGDLRQFLGPLSPYPFQNRAPWSPDPAGALLELPMACVPWARTPLIGTSWTVAPEALRSAMWAAVDRALPTIVLELHAIDLLDRQDHPALGELAPAQRDLEVRAADKIAAFDRLFARLGDGRALSTLSEAAAAWRGAT
jgi:hypothetical protein